MEHVWLLLLGYVVGSLPFGVWIAWQYKVDILKEGSKNPGATNVWRTLGWKAGLIVFVLDTLKGLAPALVARQLTGDDSWTFYAGISAVIGHSLSPFLKFKGGKGVATGLGALLGSQPIIAGIALASFIVVVAITRYISLGSIVACVVVFALGVYYAVPLPVQIGFGILGVLVIARHAANIKRLLAGTERKFGVKESSNA